MLGRKKTDKKKKQTAAQANAMSGQAGALPGKAGAVPVEQPYAALEIVTQKLPAQETVTLDLSKRKKAAHQLCGRSAVQVGTASVIGSRKTQQDAVFGYITDEWALGIVCDGMGGLTGGDIASRMALQSIADAWFAQKGAVDIPGFFRREAMIADKKVYQQKYPDGRRLKAGTTVIAAIVRGNGLYWLSVGDSKLYFIRGQEILSLNVEHNYRLELNARLRQGKMTAQEYAAEEYRADALTSYLGMGDLSQIDVSPRAYPLRDGDIALLASDGLYRSLSEEEILAIVTKNRRDMQQAANALTAAVKGRKKQDNTSVVTLRYTMERQT